MGKVSSPSAFIRSNPFQSALKSVGMVLTGLSPAAAMSAVLEVTHLPALFLSSTSLRPFSWPWPAST